jgi:hypothetical protein
MLELGVTMFTIGHGGPEFDLTELRTWIEWRNDQNG